MTGYVLCDAPCQCNSVKFILRAFAGLSIFVALPRHLGRRSRSHTEWGMVGPVARQIYLPTGKGREEI